MTSRTRKPATPTADKSKTAAKKPAAVAGPAAEQTPVAPPASLPVPAEQWFFQAVVEPQQPDEFGETAPVTLSGARGPFLSRNAAEEELRKIEPEHGTRYHLTRVEATVFIDRAPRVVEE